MSENQTQLLKNYLELTEMNYVINHIGPMLGQSELTEESLFGKYDSRCLIHNIGI